MPFNAIPDVVKCTIRHSFRGQDALNTMYFFKRTGAPTVIDVAALAGALATQWVAAVMPLLSSDLVFQSVLARDLTAENGTEALSGSVPSTAGGAGDAMPNNVSACVSLRTPFAGRHYRGRLYLAGIPREAVVENTLDPAFRLDITSAFGDMIGDDNVQAGYTWSVVAQSQANPGTPPPATIPIPGGIVTPITLATFVDGIVDSQRRRLPGRGK